jgi:hypothetical protein
MKLLERRYYTGGIGRTYDVSADGQRFLMIKAPGTDASAAPPALIVVQHCRADTLMAVSIGTRLRPYEILSASARAARARSIGRAIRT